MAETTEATRKAGRPPNKLKIDPAALPIEALTPRKRHHLCKATSVSDDDAKVIRRVTTLSVEEFQEIQKAKLQEAMDLALTQTNATIHKASALQAATVYGILGDKLTKPGPSTQNLHIHLATGDRVGAIGALLGKHAERILPQSGAIVNTAPACHSEPGSPVILEAELATPPHTGDCESPAKPI